MGVEQLLLHDPLDHHGVLQPGGLSGFPREPLDAEHPLKILMLRFRPGDRVRLTVFRDGAQQNIEVTLGR